LIGVDYGIIIAKNTFQENSGYLTSNAISIQIMNPFMEYEALEAARCGSKLSCNCNNYSADILLEDNRFERNIGGFKSTAGAISMSCYWNVTHSDNSLEGEQLFTYHGFLQGEIEGLYNYLIQKDTTYKLNMLGELTNKTQFYYYIF
jgi:hypothetical protein